MAVVADPRKLLIPDPEAKKTVLSDIFIPISLSAVGLLGVAGSRHFNRRPFLSGIQHHVLAVVGGWMIGKVMNNFINDYNSENDAIYMHYIELHPDKFPTPQRVKIGEKLEPWAPVR